MAKTLASQAKDGGSIPLARSSSPARLRSLAALAAALLAWPASACAAGPGLLLTPEQDVASVTAPRLAVGYVAARHGPGTRLDEVAGGEVRRSQMLPGRLGVARVSRDGGTTGLSADGSTLVLAGWPGRRTRLAVVDTRRLRVVRRIALPGPFAVFAISPHGDRLYLHQRSPDVLRVYDLARRRLGGVVARLAGGPISRAASRDGRWAYTLFGGAETYVQALDTVAGRSRVVPLRRHAAAIGRGSTPLIMSGHRLRVGAYAVIDRRTFAVSAPSPSPTPASSPTPAATPDPHPGDGGALWVVLGVAAVAAAAVAVRRKSSRR